MGLPSDELGLGFAGKLPDQFLFQVREAGGSSTVTIEGSVFWETNQRYLDVLYSVTEG